MRSCKCEKCGRVFHESDSSPAVHYSEPSTLCRQCTVYAATKPGGFYQAIDGEYRQKPAQPAAPQVSDAMVVTKEMMQRAGPAFTSAIKRKAKIEQALRAALEAALAQPGAPAKDRES